MLKVSPNQRASNLNVLILAAGYAVRLYPLTLNKPKPLLMVRGKPIIDYSLDKLEPLEALKRIYVVTNEKFYPHFKIWQKSLRSTFKSKLKVISDGTKTADDRLGAIGDIDYVMKKEKIKDNLLVIGGDNIFNQPLGDFINFARKKEPCATIGVFDIKEKRKAAIYGVVKVDENNKIVDFQEKPLKPKSSLVAMCLYYFSKQSLGTIKTYLKAMAKEKDATGFYISWLYKNRPTFAYRFTGKWFDIGDKYFLNEAQTYGIPRLRDERKSDG